MSRSLRIVERARADTDAIFNWIANRSLQGAISWYLAFHQAVDRIAETPELFAEAPEAQSLSRPLRETAFKTRRGRIYRIVFEIMDTDILILRVRGPGQSRLRKRDVAET